MLQIIKFVERHNKQNARGPIKLRQFCGVAIRHFTTKSAPLYGPVILGVMQNLNEYAAIKMEN